MRFLRLIFVVALAVILVAIALANRETVTLSAFPANFGQHLGGQWAVDLPLFLVIFLAFAVGMLAGLIWEWLRESHIRRQARVHSERAARLETEVDHLRHRHAAPKDEVLAIIDRPKPKSATLPAASTEPATGLTVSNGR